MQKSSEASVGVTVEEKLAVPRTLQSAQRALPSAQLGLGPRLQSPSQSQLPVAVMITVTITVTITVMITVTITVTITVMITVTVPVTILVAVLTRHHEGHDAFGSFLLLLEHLWAQGSGSVSASDQSYELLRFQTGSALC